MKKREKTTEFDRTSLIESILFEARSTRLLPEAAYRIAVLAANDVEDWLKERTAITEEDYERIVYKKLQQYNTDLAYFYLNRDKII